MENNKEQRELLKEIIGRLKEMQSKARQEAAESDSLIRWGRQTMIEEVLLMLYQMHDEMVDEILMAESPAKETTNEEDSSIKAILSKPITFLNGKMTRRAWVVCRNTGGDIVADIYGYPKPLMWIIGCGRATRNELTAGLKSIGLPDPDGKDTLNPEDYGFSVSKTDKDGQKWYK